MWRCSILATASALLDLLPVLALWLSIVHIVSAEPSLATLALYAGIALFGVLCSIWALSRAMKTSHLVAFEAVHALRLDLAHHLGEVPMGWFAQRSSAQTRSLIVDEPERLEQIIAHAIPESVSGFISWIAVTLWLFAVDWRMALVSVAMTPIALGIMAIAILRGNREIGRLHSASAAFNGAIADFFSAMPALKVFGSGQKLHARTAKTVGDFADMQVRIAQRFLLFGGTFNSLILANVCIILPAGLMLLAGGSLDIPTFLFFLILGSNYSQPFLKMINQMGQLSQVAGALEHVNKVLETPAQPDPGGVSLPEHGELVFEDVRFRHADGTLALDGVNFTVKPGSFLALVGPSGAGKSTAASLIPRLHDVTDGRITFGGTDIRNAPLADLMSRIGFLFQDTFMFSGTVADNLRVGKPDASETEMKDALRLAQAQFVPRLPKGLETALGAKGVTLSGGEKQRLAIARLILKDPDVIVLDEATAFIDPDNEVEILKALHALAKNRTVIAIAHRLHTVQRADCIVVMKAGRVDDKGTHSELLVRGGLYAELLRASRSARESCLREADRGASDDG